MLRTELLALVPFGFRFSVVCVFLYPGVWCYAVWNCTSSLSHLHICCVRSSVVFGCLFHKTGQIACTLLSQIPGSVQVCFFNSELAAAVFCMTVQYWSFFLQESNNYMYASRFMHAWHIRLVFVLFCFFVPVQCGAIPFDVKPTDSAISMNIYYIDGIIWLVRLGVENVLNVRLLSDTFRIDMNVVMSREVVEPMLL